MKENRNHTQILIFLSSTSVTCIEKNEVVKDKAAKMKARSVNFIMALVCSILAATGETLHRHQNGDAPGAPTRQPLCITQQVLITASKRFLAIVAFRLSFSRALGYFE
jgi:hypothetical protein